MRAKNYSRLVKHGLQRKAKLVYCGITSTRFVYSIYRSSAQCLIFQQINQQHTAELAKLKAAKEAAEAMQAQVKQNSREEIERMKTQYVFRVGHCPFSATASFT